MDSKTLILGLGNDILTDDGVGLAVVRELSRRRGERNGVVVRETMEMGLALLDFMVGFDQVVIVDSIQTGRNPPGTIHEVDVTGWRELTGSTPHFLGVGETLALGRQLGLAMPRQVTVVAIEVQDPYTLGTELTGAVAAAVPAAVRRLEGLLALPGQGAESLSPVHSFGGGDGAGIPGEPDDPDDLTETGVGSETQEQLGGGCGHPRKQAVTHSQAGA